MLFSSASKHFFSPVPVEVLIRKLNIKYTNGTWDLFDSVVLFGVFVYKSVVFFLRFSLGDNREQKFVESSVDSSNIVWRFYDICLRMYYETGMKQTTFSL